MSSELIDRISALEQVVSALELTVRELSERVGQTNDAVDEIKNDRALVPAQSSELAVVAADRAYDRIMTEFSETVFPEMNKLAQMVHYTAQDSDGMVDAYRREVERREGITGLLTDGKPDTRVISPHVRMFFD